MKKILLIFVLGFVFFFGKLANAQSTDNFKKSTQLTLKMIDAFKSGKSYDKMKSIFLDEKDFDKIIAYVRKIDPNNKKFEDDEGIKKDLQRDTDKLKKHWKEALNDFSKLDKEEVMVSELETEFEIEGPGMLIVETELEFKGPGGKYEVEFDAVAINGKLMVIKLREHDKYDDYEKYEGTEEMTEEGSEGEE